MKDVYEQVIIFKHHINVGETLNIQYQDKSVLHGFLLEMWII